MIEFLVGAMTMNLVFVALVIFFPDWIFASRALYHRAEAWQEGYDTGVLDERQAADWDVAEYRNPARMNPYVFDALKEQP